MKNSLEKSNEIDKDSKQDLAPVIDIKTGKEVNEGQLLFRSLANPEAYQKYQARGGSISEAEYSDILQQAENTKEIKDIFSKNAETYARDAGVALTKSKNNIDPKIILYRILRDAKYPETQTGSHYTKMSDQTLFREAMLILDDMESAKQLETYFPTISH
jgi:hypothetical protein